MPPSLIELKGGPQDGEVHVWLADCDAAPDMSRLLADDEIARANRFVFDRDKRRFIAARGILRDLLACYTAQTDVRFIYGEHGKPSLDPASSLRFNISHSHGMGVFAFVQDREIGVDIERINEKTEIEAIGRRFFAPTEYERLMALAPGKRRRAFFECWTRKEAYIKAHGAGMSIGLASFEVTFGQEAAPRLVSAADDEPDRWRMYDLPVGERFAGAVIVEGAHALHFYQWPSASSQEL